MASRPADFGVLLARVGRALERQDLEFMVIGGQAVLLHGRPRLTEDIDLTLAAGPDALATVLAVCELEHLTPLPEDVYEFVRRTFVLPSADESTSVRIDFIFSTTPYEREAIRRAIRVEVEGHSVPFATPEDLVLHKVFAGRARDIEDAVSVIRRSGPDFDWSALLTWAEAFAEVPGREDLPHRLEALRQEAE